MMLSYYYRITALKIRRFRDLLFINMIKPYMENGLYIEVGTRFLTSAPLYEHFNCCQYPSVKLASIDVISIAILIRW